jgi:hypothetical protein
MRRAAVLAAVAVIVAGLAVFAPGYLTRKRDYVAVTPQAPTIEPPTAFPLPAHATACMDLVALDNHSEQARLQAAAPGRRPLPLELLLSGPGYRAHARVGPRLADGVTVVAPVRPPPRPLTASVCVRNLGGRPVRLAGVGDRSRSRSGITVNGALSGITFAGYTSGVGFVLMFYEREPTSILSRLPLSLRRMAVLRPGVIAPATLWLLLALFVAGVPAAAVWAFARALRHDEVAEAEPPA